MKMSSISLYIRIHISLIGFRIAPPKCKTNINIHFATYFICFTMVLFPDSPAPVGRLKY